MARRRFFVNEIRGGRAQINGEDAHHLTRVLRIEVGQKYEISDNRAVYLAEVEAARKDLVSFSVIAKIDAPEPLVDTTVIAALIKFDHFEWLLEKATELGAQAVVPFMAERSEKGLDRAAERRIPRWHKIVREASEQCRRARLPEIGPPISFDDALKLDAQFRIALDEDISAKPLLQVLPTQREHSSIAILVGPEGGWTERERTAFQAARWAPVSLGPNILRAETAAAAALAVVNAASFAR